MSERGPPMIEQAFDGFLLMLHARGFRGSHQVVVTESSAGRAATAHKDSAAFRLVWALENQTLTLSISHGPPIGASTGWLDLYCAVLRGGTLHPDQTDFTFESAISYGLDLICFHA